MIKLQLDVEKQPLTDCCVMLKVLGCDQQNEVLLEASQQQCVSGTDIGVNAV